MLKQLLLLLCLHNTVFAVDEDPTNADAIKRQRSRLETPSSLPTNIVLSAPPLPSAPPAQSQMSLAPSAPVMPASLRVQNLAPGTVLRVGENGQLEVLPASAEPAPLPPAESVNAIVRYTPPHVAVSVDSKNECCPPCEPCQPIVCDRCVALNLIKLSIFSAEITLGALGSYYAYNGGNSVALQTIGGLIVGLTVPNVITNLVIKDGDPVRSFTGIAPYVGAFTGAHCHDCRLCCPVYILLFARHVFELAGGAVLISMGRGNEFAPIVPVALLAVHLFIGLIDTCTFLVNSNS